MMTLLKLPDSCKVRVVHHNENGVTITTNMDTTSALCIARSYDCGHMPMGHKVAMTCEFDGAQHDVIQITEDPTLTGELVGLGILVGE